MFASRLKKKFESGDYNLESIRVLRNVEICASTEDRKLTDQEVLSYFLWLLPEGVFGLCDEPAYPDNIVWDTTKLTYCIDNIHRVALTFPDPSAKTSEIYAIQSPNTKKLIRLRFYPNTDSYRVPSFVTAIDLADGSRFIHRFSRTNVTLTDAAVKVLNSKIGWKSLRQQLTDFPPIRPFSLDEAQKAILNLEFIDGKAPWVRFGEIAVLEHVLRQGIDPNTLDGSGCNAMHYAWCPDVVELLTSYKADINWCGGVEYGTPLDDPISRDVEMALIDKGALHYGDFRGYIGGVFRAGAKAKDTLAGTEIYKRKIHSWRNAAAEQIAFVDGREFSPPDSAALRDCAAWMAMTRERHGRSVEEFSLYDVNSQELIGRYHFANGFHLPARK